jgi:hypothetical protein
MPFSYSNANTSSILMQAPSGSVATPMAARLSARLGHDFHYHIGCAIHPGCGRGEIRRGVDETA